MLDLLRKIFGIHSPSRWGMTKKEYERLKEDIAKTMDTVRTEPILHHIGVDLANGKDFTSPPTLLKK